MTKWTEQQQQAIQARNATLLISAAAGSGKTAVLVERILALLREGASLDRMLIVTFTRAAAAEMRQRLHRRLCQEAAREPGWTWPSTTWSLSRNWYGIYRKSTG